MHARSRTYGPGLRPDASPERLEAREVPAATAALAAGVLTVTGDAADDRIAITDSAGALVVTDGTSTIGQFPSADVSTIVVNAGDGDDVVRIDRSVTQPVTLDGGSGNNKVLGGGGLATITAGDGKNLFAGGTDVNAFLLGGGTGTIIKTFDGDTVAGTGSVLRLQEVPPPGLPPSTSLLGLQQETLSVSDVEALLSRAAAASSSSDAIIVVTDRNGRILGVRVESGVDPALTSNPELLTFAIDGALAKARTGSFFGTNQVPLNSRTIQFLAQTTVTERETNSNPNIPDLNSPLRGSGVVAPVGIFAHFPPGIAFTPTVDLEAIEFSNRDTSVHPGPDQILGTPDDIPLARRLNADPAFVPAGQETFAPDSYGFESGVFVNAQPRGLGTLPGGIPVYKNGQAVGAIGVFFPGTTGFATEENSALSSTYDPTKPDRSLEAEWIAYAAVGGTTTAIDFPVTFPVGELGGVPVPAGFGLPIARIDLVGITLPLFGPGNPREGLQTLAAVGAAVGQGNPNDGTNQVVDRDANNDGVFDDPVTVRVGLRAPEGWLVTPHDGPSGLTAAEVERIIVQAINQNNLTRSAVRLPGGSRARLIFTVTDSTTGEILGQYRSPDATNDAIGVTTSKARSVAYYSNAEQLQDIDKLPGIPVGTAVSTRTFRYLGLPFFPEGVDVPREFGAFSQLNDGGANAGNGRIVGDPLPASAFQSGRGYDSFNPQSLFHSPFNVANQNGVSFIPGGVTLHKLTATGSPTLLVGGFGSSGDGADQDDIGAFAGQAGFNVPVYVPRADQIIFKGVRLPYLKFNRNPEG